MDDNSEARGVALDDLLQSGPRVSAVGAERIHEGVHHDDILPTLSAAAIVEAIVLRRNPRGKFTRHK